MPRTKTKSDEDELDSLVDDLDDLEEDDEVEIDFDDDEDEDPDEAPKARKKSKKSKAKPKKEGVGTKEVADAAGIESRQLRMFLRSAGYQPKDERDGRYHWKSLNDPEVKDILRKIKEGAVEKLNKEKLADLKDKKKDSRKSRAKSRKAKAKSRKKAEK